MSFRKLFAADWAQEICLLFKNTSSVYKKTFLYTFIVLNIVYAFHTMNFLWGNHDWTDVLDRVYNEHTYGLGRFSQYWLQILLFDGKILPILNNFVAFAGLCMSGLLLARYWNIPLNLFSYLSFSLFFATSPYFLPWLYYIKLSVANAWLPFFAILALIISQRSCGIQNTFNKIALNALAILLIIYCLGVYPVIISTLAVVFFAKTFFIRMDNEKENVCWVIINTVVAVVIVKLILLYMQLAGIMGNFYNTKMLTCSQMFDKLNYIFFISFKQFTFSTTFIDANYKVALLVLLIVGFVAYMVSLFNSIKNRQNSYQEILIAIILILVMLFSTKIVALLTPGDYGDFAPRMDYFGLLYFYMFALGILLKMQKHIYKNIVLVLMIILIPMAIQRDADAMKVWKLGFDAEQKLNERIIGRIETQPQFDMNKKYTVIYIGTPFALRSNFYTPKAKDEFTSIPMLSFCYNVVWPTTDHDIDFYYVKRFKQISYNTENLVHVNSKEYLKYFKDYILNEAKAWPDKNSIYVDDKYIVIVYNQEALDKAKQYLQTELVK